MNWREIDFRYDWVFLTFSALKSGFYTIRQQASAESWFDGTWQVEHADAILGVAFVAAQAYLVGTVEDVNHIRQSRGQAEKSKIDYYKDDPHPLPNGISRILLINSIANYYKHHDEWDDPWTPNLTTTTLAAVGIVKSTEFPCYEAAKTLWGPTEVENLDKLAGIIKEWREYILAKYK